MQGLHPATEGDRLTWLSEEELYQIIRSEPSEQHLQAIYRLRDVHQIDNQSAKHILEDLPYMISCRCNPMSYRKEYFVWSEHLCLEVPIREVTDDQGYIRWRNKMQSYPGVTMAFLTAAGDRLMLIFNLRKPCRDRELFRLFYRVFANAFFDKHSIDYIPTHQETDPAKSICLSYDPDAYYCMGVKPINIDDYLNQRNIDDLKEEQRQLQKRNARKEKSKNKKNAPPTDGAIENIKSILGMTTSGKRKSSNKEPGNLLKQVDQNMDLLNDRLRQVGIELEEVQLLPAGRKWSVLSATGRLTLNVLFDKDCNLSITCAPGCNADKQEQKKIKDLVTNFIYNIRQ